MKPVSHPSNTRVLQAPAGWDQSGTPVEPLGITDIMCPGEVPAVMSFWEPDDIDRANIAGGGLVGLSIIGRTMQPAVVVSVAPDERVWPRDHPAVAVGIEDAARWVDARREVFDAEHGMTDPETGAFEYGTGTGAVARSEYSAELQEIAEGIRGLMSTNTRPRFGSTRPMAVDLSQDDRDKLFAELFGKYGITSPVEDVVETVMRFLETSGVIQTSPFDSVSESAAESPTHGMTLGERIAHVGGRTNAQGYVEFGSPMAVGALIKQVLRDQCAPVVDREQIIAEFLERSGQYLTNDATREAAIKDAVEAALARQASEQISAPVLQAILRCRYPVCTSINPKGHGWDTTRLDDVVAELSTAESLCAAAREVASDMPVPRAEPRMNPWVPDEAPDQARRIGKTQEELAELSKVLARISIQGMGGIDPTSGKTNRQQLHEETADVVAQIRCNIKAFDMDERAMQERTERKVALMAEWESLVGEVNAEQAKGEAS